MFWGLIRCEFLKINKYELNSFHIYLTWMYYFIIIFRPPKSLTFWICNRFTMELNIALSMKVQPPKTKEFDATTVP